MTSMIDYQNTVNQWQNMSQYLREPQTEAEYDSLLEFADRLSSEYSTSHEPMKGLFWLLTTYLNTWEQKHDPWVKNS